MNAERRNLLYKFKALSDENRLKLYGYLCQGEHNVSELAKLLKLSEPTVSHHIAKLRSAGMVNLREEGTHRYYRAHPGALLQFKDLVMRIDTLPIESEAAESDNAWIDALDMDESSRKVLRDYTFNGELTRIPSRQKKLLVVLDWLATKFQPDKMYTEKEVNAIISEVNNDFATLRRDLVDFGYLRRERGGGQYWVTPENEPA